MIEAIVYGKDGCHLCEAVEAEMRSMKTVDLTLVDVEGDTALQSRYWARVPVVMVEGKVVFEAKMMDTEGSWKGRLRSLLNP